MATVPDIHTKGRYEVKYLLPPEVRTALRCDLDLLMHRDAYSANGAYAVSTLYFDSPALTGFYDKLDGVPDRLKFRSRQYGDDPTTRRLEIKEKTYDRSRKRRAALNPEAYGALVHGTFPATMAADAVVRAFWHERSRRALRPRAIVTYHRDAFVWRPDASIRVTIDTGLRVQRADSFERRMLTALNALPAEASILEIKWDASFPEWIQRLVRKYSLRHAALSKYCLGIDALIRHGFIPRS